MKLITTSWDDGHVTDFRLAELLEKYNLQGTFYIPAANNERTVMSEEQIVSLSKKFEIGGHTLNHASLNKTSRTLFEREIKGCYHWLNNLLGEPPISFCFPRGAYNNEAIEYCFTTGFKILRTTELLNPWWNDNTSVVPTTLQVYPHPTFTYYKHLIKRVKLKSLLLYLKSNNLSDLERLVTYYMDYIQLHGGCFHLWGHSWEIEENNLWSVLENLFDRMSNRVEFSYINNKEMLRYKSTETNKTY